MIFVHGNTLSFLLMVLSLTMTMTSTFISSFIPQTRNGLVPRETINNSINKEFKNKKITSQIVQREVARKRSTAAITAITAKFASTSSEDESQSATAIDTKSEDGNGDDDGSTSVASVKTKKMSSVFSESVQTEAREVLEKVGWAGVAPDLSDPEKPMTSEDPFVQQIDEGIRRDFGVGLDDLLNPAKVVNLERELYQLKEELQNTDDDDTATIESIQNSIEKKQSKLAIERRSVFRDWLKNIFLGQAIISLGVSYVMATNPSTLFGGFDWFYSNSMDISIQVLGYWFWWLFIIPSLRSRRPRGFEKKALDIAFLGTPLVSILAPVVTKDTELIWTANFIVVTASYGFAYLINDEETNDSDDANSNRPAWLKFVYKSLDFGSGRERGARK